VMAGISRSIRMFGGGEFINLIVAHRGYDATRKSSSGRLYVPALAQPVPMTSHSPIRGRPACLAVSPGSDQLICAISPLLFGGWEGVPPDTAWGLLPPCRDAFSRVAETAPAGSHAGTVTTLPAIAGCFDARSLRSSPPAVWPFSRALPEVSIDLLDDTALRRLMAIEFSPSGLASAHGAFCERLRCDTPSIAPLSVVWRREGRSERVRFVAATRPIAGRPRGERAVWGGGGGGGW